MQCKRLLLRTFGVLGPFAVLLPAVTASAQSFQHMQKPDNLSPAEVTTLERLHELSQLPDGAWRVHEGDLPHGELPNVSDAEWKTVAAPATVGKGAVWFRREIVIPRTLHGYSLNGTDVSFQFQADANGPMPEIIYFDGRRVALGDDLEEIPLFHNVKPGDKVLVAVKLLPTVDDKRFRGVQMKISFSPSRPSPQDVEKELISAAYLVPSLAPGDATKMATLQQAIAAVSVRALDGGNQTAFDASLKASEAKLEALKPLLQTANFHLSGNAHIDAAWLWPWTETVDVVKRTFTSAAQLMSEYPTYTFSQSAAQYSEWMADKYPVLNKEIAQRVKEGRWEIVGGMWVEPDLNMPDGESQVRQLLVGQAEFQKLYGVTAKIGWNPDSFGYNWQLPQIYKRSGVDYFVTQKMHWNDTNQLPLKLFWWESPDGSKVLTYFPDDYAYTNLDPVRLSASLAKARTRSDGMTNMLDLYGVGDHGGGPTRTMLDEGLHWMEPNKVVPKEEFGTALPYFQQVQAQLNPDSPTWNYETLGRGDAKLPPPAPGQISVPTWNSELYFEYHRGVFTTQAEHKRSMRESEEWMLNAEKVAALASLSGKEYPANELNEAWKKVLFNQFHDLAAGSGIAVIYRDAQKDYQQVHWATDEISKASLKTIADRVDTRGKGDVPVFVWNPLAWERTGLVEVDVTVPRAMEAISLVDAKGHVVPSQVLSADTVTHSFRLLVQVPAVPSMGYTVLHAVEGKKDFSSDLKTTNMEMENANLRVRVDPGTGCITSLYDKRGGFETLAAGGCGNELQAYHDLPKNYDAWNVDPGTYDVPPTLIHQVDSVQLVESGPLRSVIRVKRTWGQSTFSQDLILYRGADEVVVKNDIGWHETHVLLKAAFPLAASAPQATFEIPYGSIQRPTTRNNSFEKAQFEVPAMRWADEGDGQHGFSLINESKYGYDAVGNTLRLTLLRSPTWPDPDADRGEQHFSYALYPHAGAWKSAETVHRGWEFNYGLQAMQVTEHEGAWPAEHSFAEANGAHVVLTALKKAEDGYGLIARFYEWSGAAGDVTLRAPDGVKGAEVVNLMEQPTGQTLTVTGNEVKVPVTPYMIQTVRLSY
jgi:alpha-mannosidase